MTLAKTEADKIEASRQRVARTIREGLARMNPTGGMPYELARDCCHVRSAIFRISNPDQQYWKNQERTLDERVPDEEKAAHDWAEYDTREGIIVVDWRN
jgi:hypothetical protein